MSGLWRFETGDYRTKDGQHRIVCVSRAEWQLQEWRPWVGVWWSWVSTRQTKRECVADLEALR